MTPRRSIVCAAILAFQAWAAESTADVAASQAESPIQLAEQLEDALESYERGSALWASAPDEALVAFRQARDKFQATVDAGIRNGLLYYNLGNTHVRLGEIGRAIADYRRAERLIPHDHQLKANLRFARSLTRDRIEPAGKRVLLRTLFFWHYSWSLRARRAAAMIGYGAFWVLLVIKVLWPRVGVRYPSLVCLVLWATLGTSVAVDLHARNRPGEGVLVANDVVVRKGNGDGYGPQFQQPLHEGVEFKAVERRGSWIRIELIDGNQGWVRDRQVELF